MIQTILYLIWLPSVFVLSFWLPITVNSASLLLPWKTCALSGSSSSFSPPHWQPTSPGPPCAPPQRLTSPSKTRTTKPPPTRIISISSRCPLFHFLYTIHHHSWVSSFKSWLVVFSLVSDDSEWILGICWHGQREVYVENFDVQEWYCSSKELLDVGTSQILMVVAETFNSLFYFHYRCRETCKFWSFFSFCKCLIGKRGSNLYNSII